jgi:GGDEF domain-containing protein
MTAATQPILLVTEDDGLAKGFEAAAREAGWKVERAAVPPADAPKDGIVVLDDRLSGRNAYETCRELRARTRARIFVAHRAGDRSAPSLARFCGAEGALAVPSDPATLRETLRRAGAPISPEEMRRRTAGGGRREGSFAEAVLRDVASEAPVEGWMEVLVDPETKLFHAPFLLYKLDEEFKRAERFRMPLACVVVGFEGEASADTLLELAGVFLLESRDTDVLGRFDLNTFVFLLPNTGEEGARSMASRILSTVKKKSLADLVGDPLVPCVGFALAPSSAYARRDELLRAALAACAKARKDGTQIEAGS